MLFYSTNHLSPLVDFRQATLQGQPPDKGLYFPVDIPLMRIRNLSDIRLIPKEELLFEVIRPYVENTIPIDQLRNIVTSAINFDFPLQKVTRSIYSLELFHGPTLAFKDVGARFLSRCLGYFKQSENRKTIVLVATSGDTGGAVANSFAGVEGIHTVILYPEGKVSEVQELQLTTCGNNVTALQVMGDFDECQKLVKSAFSDTDLNNSISLTSANSINVARWLPQQFYYLEALRQWNETELPCFSVPSGNFGNLTAGLLAIKSTGLQISFLAAMNSNTAVHDYLTTGLYEARKTIPTISNAMDVGDPSNFSRILALFGKNYHEIKKHIHSYCISDDFTRKTIQRIFREEGYLLDPHGAVGFAALEKFISGNNCKGIFLETAHPIKFADLVEPLIKKSVEVPQIIKSLYARTKSFTRISPVYETVKELLMDLGKK